jgi:hypothetical protein
MKMALIVKCPRCKKIATSQPDGVLEYFDPEFKCKTRGCLYVGRLHAVTSDNPLRGEKEVFRRPEVVVGKTRKPRSDAGKKRGAYGPRK